MAMGLSASSVDGGGDDLSGTRKINKIRTKWKMAGGRPTVNMVRVGLVVRGLEDCCRLNLGR